MPEDLRGHVSVAAGLPRQLELGVQVVAGVLVHRQRLAEPKVGQLDGAGVEYQALPAAGATPCTLVGQLLDTMLTSFIRTAEVGSDAKLAVQHTSAAAAAFL